MLKYLPYILFVAGLTLLLLSTGTVPQLLGAGMIIGGIALYFINRRQAAPATPPKPVTIMDPVEKNLHLLVDLNLQLRIDPSRSPQVLAATEALIDAICRVIVRLNQEYPGSELAFTCNQMAKKYLPELLEPFIRLRPEARQEREPKLLETISALGDAITATTNLVEQGDKIKLDAQAKFLQAKFIGPAGV